MPYTLNKSDGTQLLVLADQTANTSATSLTLIGRGLLNYGKYEAENLIKMLENFARSTPPSNPLPGQFWYDTSSPKKMKVWDGSAWRRIMMGTDDSNVVPGLTFGAGLTVSGGNTVTANMLSVAGRTGAVVLGVSDVAGAAPIASPDFTGAPKVPTAATGTNTTQAASTAFVRNQIEASATNNILSTGISDGLTVSSNVVKVLSASAARIAVSASGVDIAATYAGQTSIVTLGTVATGTWNATEISVAKGGTGATTKDQALTNLGALKFNAVANSLATVGTGIIVNNAGATLARKIVSGSPEKLSVTNPDGTTGDITIALIGTENTGPIPIEGGGTGKVTKAEAFNALSPATTAGDMIYLNNAGTHSRLAGQSGPAPYYLESGSNSPIPRWTNNVNATTLGGENLAYVLSRGSHTGENNADKLAGQLPAYYLDYANFTGAPPTTFINTSTQFAEAGWIVFRGGFQMVWAKVSPPRNALTTFNFPLAFPNACFGATVSAGVTIGDAKDNAPYVTNVNKEQLVIYSALDVTGTCYYLAYGY